MIKPIEAAATRRTIAEYVMCTPFPRRTIAPPKETAKIPARRPRLNNSSWLATPAAHHNRIPEMRSNQTVQSNISPRTSYEQPIGGMGPDQPQIWARVYPVLFRADNRLPTTGTSALWRTSASEH